MRWIARYGSCGPTEARRAPRSHADSRFSRLPLSAAPTTGLVRAHSRFRVWAQGIAGGKLHRRFEWDAREGTPPCQVHAMASSGRVLLVARLLKYGCGVSLYYWQPIVP